MTAKIDQLEQKLKEKTSQLAVQASQLESRLKHLEVGLSETTRLSNAAQPSVPADVTPTPISRSSLCGHSLQSPRKFDGKTTWESYHAQFEIVAELNDWNVTEKAAFLATSLEGSAANMLGDMDSTKRYSNCSLVTLLETVFGTTEQRELSRMKLRRRKYEPLPELADDVERLYRLVYR